MLTLSASVGNVSTMVDRGNKVTIYTSEISPEAMTELFRIKQANKEVLVVFKILGDESVNVVDVQKQPPKPRSKSQELRIEILKYWEGLPDNTRIEPFEKFYEITMNQFIELVRNNFIR